MPDGYIYKNVLYTSSLILVNINVRWNKNIHSVNGSVSLGGKFLEHSDIFIKYLAKMQTCAIQKQQQQQIHRKYRGMQRKCDLQFLSS